MGPLVAAHPGPAPPAALRPAAPLGDAQNGACRKRKLGEAVEGGLWGAGTRCAAHGDQAGCTNAKPTTAAPRTPPSPMLLELARRLTVCRASRRPVDTGAEVLAATQRILDSHGDGSVEQLAAALMIATKMIAGQYCEPGRGAEGRDRMAQFRARVPRATQVPPRLRSRTRGVLVDEDPAGARTPALPAPAHLPRPAPPCPALPRPPRPADALPCSLVSVCAGVRPTDVLRAELDLCVAADWDFYGLCLAER